MLPKINAQVSDFISDFDTTATLLGNISNKEFAVSPPLNFYHLMIRMVIALIIVIVLIYIVAYIMKKVLPKEKKIHKEYGFDVLSIKNLGHNKSLMSVRVNGRVLVIGVTNNNINCLTEFIENEEIENFTIEEETPDETIHIQ